jgi:hypothetical protein
MRLQPRMYRVRPSEMDEWIQEWREHVLPLRRHRTVARHLAETNSWIVAPLDEGRNVDDDAEGDQGEPEQQRRLEA